MSDFSTRSGFVFQNNIGPDNPIDLSKIVLGKTKVSIKPVNGCCNTTLCMAEYTVLDIGQYRDKSKKFTMFRLEGDVFITANMINYILNPE